MSEGTWVGIDLGNTRVKVLAVGRGGRVVGASARATSGARVSWRTGGGMEIRRALSAERLWRLVEACLADLAAQGVEPQQSSVAVAGMGGPVVVLGADGKALLPVIGGMMRGLSPDDDGPGQAMDGSWYRETGYRPEQSALPGLRALARLEQERFARAAAVVSVEGYIAYRLCGEMAWERSVASATGGWNHDAEKWHDGFWEGAGLESASREPVLDGGRALGEVATGAFRGAAVMVGGHDYLCAELALGIRENSAMLDMLGTFEVTSVPLIDPWPREPVGGEVVDAATGCGRRTLMVELLVGPQLAWIEQTLGLSGDERLAEVRREMGRLSSDDLDDLVYLPFMYGEPVPRWRPGRRASFVGLRSDHSAAHMYRAVLAGLACHGELALRHLETVVGGRREATVVAGGGTRDAYWLQLKADVGQRRLMVPRTADSTALGAAALAAGGVAAREWLDELRRALLSATTVVEPRPGCGTVLARYQEVVGERGDALRAAAATS